MSEQPALPWMIEFRIPGASSVAKLRVEGEAVIGRVDRDNGVLPDLDLTPWGAMEKGVAPRHVRLAVVDEQLMVADLGSGKPTLLNSALLTATPHVLNHGDDLQLGVLHLQVNVIASPNQGGIVQHQQNVELVDDPAPGRGQSILIVEDEAETAEIFRLIMERAGFKPHICREVVSAIRVLNSEAPSAIILDLMLPDIHGLELCRYVRRDVERREIPIVVVSAAAKQATINQVMEVGADVFLGKPFSMHELVRVVASLVKWYESKKPLSQTKQLVGTARLKGMPADVRRDAVVLFVAGYQEPIAVVVPSRITIGRRSGSTSRRPHVDLERYGAFDAGVSRIHAAIHREPDGFSIEDLGSSNGTFVNNVRIAPNQRVPLKNATEVILGSLPVRVFFFTEDDLEIIQGAAPLG